MAKNMVHRDAKQLSVVCTHPATPASGDPVRFGERCGVALTDERTGGDTSVQFGGSFNLSVKGVDAGGNSAVALGDKLYYVDADTPKLSKKVAGHFFGYAAAAITSGATATIQVDFNN
jgi:predicted RecA/RadA family phage recombinase